MNVQTLRYYERRGAARRARPVSRGHRLYDEQAVTTLRVIKAAQRLGFTPDEVADLLRRPHATATAGAARRAAGQGRVKLAEVEQRLADLAVVRDTLLAALDAGCDDLLAGAGEPCCPLPFVEIARSEVGAVA